MSEAHQHGPGWFNLQFRKFPLVIKKIQLTFHFLAGYYLYTETSHPRRPGDKAIITFKGANSKPVCLSFYYHMYGATIGKLNIRGGGRIIWSKSGNQGNAWKKALVSITSDINVSVEEIELQFQWYRYSRSSLCWQM